MACDAQSLIDLAYANGYAALSDRDLREVIAAEACAGGGGGGVVNGELLFYTASDPNSQGLVPTDQTKPAFAYKKDGTGPSYGWNPTNLDWE